MNRDVVSASVASSSSPSSPSSYQQYYSEYGRHLDHNQNQRHQCHSHEHRKKHHEGYDDGEAPQEVEGGNNNINGTNTNTNTNATAVLEDGICGRRGDGMTNHRRNRPQTTMNSKNDAFCNHQMTRGVEEKGERAIKRSSSSSSSSSASASVRTRKSAPALSTDAGAAADLTDRRSRSFSSTSSSSAAGSFGGAIAQIRNNHQGSHKDAGAVLDSVEEQIQAVMRRMGMAGGEEEECVMNNGESQMMRNSNHNNHNNNIKSTSQIKQYHNSNAHPRYSHDEHQNQNPHRRHHHHQHQHQRRDSRSTIVSSVHTDDCDQLYGPTETPFRLSPTEQWNQDRAFDEELEKQQHQQRPTDSKNKTTMEQQQQQHPAMTMSSPLHLNNIPHASSSPLGDTAGGVFMPPAAENTHNEEEEEDAHNTSNISNGMCRIGQAVRRWVMRQQHQYVKASFGGDEGVGDNGVVQNNSNNQSSNRRNNEVDEDEEDGDGLMVSVDVDIDSYQRHDPHQHRQPGGVFDDGHRQHYNHGPPNGNGRNNNNAATTSSFTTTTDNNNNMNQFDSEGLVSPAEAEGSTPADAAIAHVLDRDRDFINNNYYRHMYHKTNTDSTISDNNQHTHQPSTRQRTEEGEEEREQHHHYGRSRNKNRRGNSSRPSNISVIDDDAEPNAVLPHSRNNNKNNNNNNTGSSPSSLSPGATAVVPPPPQHQLPPPQQPIRAAASIPQPSKRPLKEACTTIIFYMAVPTLFYCLLTVAYRFLHSPVMCGFASASNAASYVFTYFLALDIPRWAFSSVMMVEIVQCSHAVSDLMASEEEKQRAAAAAIAAARSDQYQQQQPGLPPPPTNDSVVTSSSGGNNSAPYLFQQHNQMALAVGGHHHEFKLQPRPHRPLRTTPVTALLKHRHTWMLFIISVLLSGVLHFGAGARNLRAGWQIALEVLLCIPYLVYASTQRCTSLVFPVIWPQWISLIYRWLCPLFLTLPYANVLFPVCCAVLERVTFYVLYLGVPDYTSSAVKLCFAHVGTYFAHTALIIQAFRLEVDNIAHLVVYFILVCAGELIFCTHIFDVAVLGAINGVRRCHHKYIQVYRNWQWEREQQQHQQQQQQQGSSGNINALTNSNNTAAGGAGGGGFSPPLSPMAVSSLAASQQNPQQQQQQVTSSFQPLTFGPNDMRLICAYSRTVVFGLALALKLPTVFLLVIPQPSILTSFASPGAAEELSTTSATATNNNNNQQPTSPAPIISTETVATRAGEEAEPGSTALEPLLRRVRQQAEPSSSSSRNETAGATGEQNGGEMTEQQPGRGCYGTVNPKFQTVMLSTWGLMFGAWIVSFLLSLLRRVVTHTMLRPLVIPTAGWSLLTGMFLVSFNYGVTAI